MHFPTFNAYYVFSGKEGTTGIAEEINEGEIKAKEVEMPSEEPLKLMGGQKNNVNDPVRNENLVSKKFLTVSG